MCAVRLWLNTGGLFEAILTTPAEVSAKRTVPKKSGSVFTEPHMTSSWLDGVAPMRYKITKARPSIISALATALNGISAFSDGIRLNAINVTKRRVMCLDIGSSYTGSITCNKHAQSSQTYEHLTPSRLSKKND